MKAGESQKTRETCRRISFEDFALRDIDQMLRALIRRHRKAASAGARRSFCRNTSPPIQCSLDRERIPGASSRWPFVDAPRTVCLSRSRCFRPQRDSIVFTPWNKALKWKKAPFKRVQPQRRAATLRSFNWVIYTVFDCLSICLRASRWGEVVKYLIWWRLVCSSNHEWNLEIMQQQNKIQTSVSCSFTFQLLYIY